MNAEAWDKAVRCVQFVVRVAELQMRPGRFFYFEHPLSATSWAVVDDLIRLRATDGVEGVVLHMCQFGLMSKDQDGPGPAKKPARVLTNLPCVAGINKKCPGGHRHVTPMSGLGLFFPLDLDFGPAGWPIVIFQNELAWDTGL